jgi:hypothetical protein
MDLDSDDSSDKMDLSRRLVARAALCLAPYRITPKENVSSEVISAFTKKLETETNITTLWMSSNKDGIKVVFWSQNLTPAQKKSYKNETAVRRILFRCNLNESYTNNTRWRLSSGPTSSYKVRNHGRLRSPVSCLICREITTISTQAC